MSIVVVATFRPPAGASEHVRDYPLRAWHIADLSPAALDVVDLLPRLVAGGTIASEEPGRTLHSFSVATAQTCYRDARPHLVQVTKTRQYIDPDEPVNPVTTAGPRASLAPLRSEDE